jgi:hypothetical protein
MPTICRSIPHLSIPGFLTARRGSPTMAQEAAQPQWKRAKRDATASAACPAPSSSKMLQQEDWAMLVASYKQKDEIREMVIKKCRDMQVKSRPLVEACMHASSSPDPSHSLGPCRSSARTPSSRCTVGTLTERRSRSAVQRRLHVSCCPPSRPILRSGTFDLSHHTAARHLSPPFSPALSPSHAFCKQAGFVWQCLRGVCRGCDLQHVSSRGAGAPVARSRMADMRRIPGRLDGHDR